MVLLLSFITTLNIIILRLIGLDILQCSLSYIVGSGGVDMLRVVCGLKTPQLAYRPTLLFSQVIFIFIPD